MYSSFLFICFFLFCLFQLLDSPSQKNTPSDFHQEVAFNQYFYLHQEWRCLDYPRANGQIFVEKFVGRTWPKEEIIYFYGKICIIF